jgi:hypothetical protein
MRRVCANKNNSPSPEQQPIFIFEEKDPEDH